MSQIKTTKKSGWKILRQTSLFSLMFGIMPLVSAQPGQRQFKEHSFNIDAVNYRVGQIGYVEGNVVVSTMSNVTSIKSTGSLITGDKKYPVITDYVIYDNTAKSREIVITENSDQKEIKYMEHADIKTIPAIFVGEAQSKYPAMFLNKNGCSDHSYSDIVIGDFKYKIVKTTVNCKYDLESDAILETSTKNTVSDVVVPNQAKPIYDPQFRVINYTNGYVTLPYGCRSADKSIKYNEYRELYYITYDTEGKVINNVTQKFDYPRHQKYGVSDPGTMNSLFVLGYYPMLGKNNDPDRSNHNIVMLDKTGNLLAHHSFKFGSSERTDISDFYSFSNGDEHYLFFKGLTKPDNMYGFLKCSQKGIDFVTSIGYNELKEKTSGNPNVCLGLMMEDYFYITDHKILEDNSILLIGQIPKKLSIPTKDASNPMSATIQHKWIYGNHVILHFNPQGNLLKQYTLQTDLVSDNEYANTPQILKITADEVLFLFNKITRIQEEKEKLYMERIRCDKTNFISQPMLVSINPTTMTMNVNESVFKENQFSYPGINNSYTDGDRLFIYGYDILSEKTNNKIKYTPWMVVYETDL